MRNFQKFTTGLFIFFMLIYLLAVGAHAAEDKSMTKQRMLEYCEVYNSEDYDKVASEYYAEDIVFKTTRGETVGREAVRDNFKKFHQDVREITKFKNILIDGDGAAVEVEAEFTFKKEMPSFGDHGGTVWKGDVRHVGWGAFYKLRGDRITEIKLYNWR